MHRHHDLPVLGCVRLQSGTKLGAFCCGVKYSPLLYARCRYRTAAAELLLYAPTSQLDLTIVRW
jgi:hypothetical protein